MVLCMNSIIYFCFLFSNAISVTQMQLHVIPSHFASVVTESGMAEEVKMVKDSIVQKGDKECWLIYSMNLSPWKP